MSKLQKLFKLSSLLVASAIYTVGASETHLYQSFDELSSPNDLTIHTQFTSADSVKGINERAWRTDGFSSWAELPLALNSSESFSAFTWLALESFPSDLEVPTKHISPSSIMNQREKDAGFDIYIDTYGRWGLWFATDKGEVVVKANGIYPIYQWSHVGFSFNASTNEVSLYLNGNEVGSEILPDGAKFKPSDLPLTLAKSHKEVEIINFTANRLNAAYDELSVVKHPLTAKQIKQEFLKYGKKLPNAESALLVPDSRFEGDHLRPLYHAMPPANWTNEPHGLVRKNGTWHMFYQRTPNAPVKTQMLWGHMSSDDLIHWQHQPDALRPSLDSNDFGTDMKGIWSGDVLVENDKAYAFYTSVNHSSSFNPAISLAIAEDEELNLWQKQGPLFAKPNIRDFRDPYLWQQNGIYHMIVGASFNGALGVHGGLVYYTSSDLVNWQLQPEFSSISFSRMDQGWDIWEMPVFEKLGVDGDGNVKYILSVTPIRPSKASPNNPTRPVYWIGEWDGNLFKPDFIPPKKLDPIHGYLAPTVAKNGQNGLVAIGVVDERRRAEGQQSAGWNNTFSFPRQWYLMPDGISLGQRPYTELEVLRSSNAIELTTFTLASQEQLITKSRLVELIVEFDTDISAKQYGLILGSTGSIGDENYEATYLYYDAKLNKLVLDKSFSSLSKTSLEQQKFETKIDTVTYGVPTKFQVFIDHSIVEIFINDALALSFRIYPALAQSNEIKLFANGGQAKVNQVRYWPLSINYQLEKAFSTPSTLSQIAHGVNFPTYGFEQILGDFDNATEMLEQGWQTTGDFKNPTSANSWQGTAKFVGVGKSAVSTCEINNNEKGCDASTGEFISPTFVVSSDKPILRLLMAGGNGSVDVGLKVIRMSDNEIVKSMLSNSCTPSYIDGNDDWVSIDLSNYIGEELQLVIYDNYIDGCGFISFDHVHMTTISK